MDAPYECRFNRRTKHPPDSYVVINDFREYVEILDTGPEFAYTQAVLTQRAQVITVFVKNIGGGTVSMFLQNSPNGTDFVNDQQILTLEGGNMGYLVPYIFSKYTRLAATGSCDGKVQVWTQMQMQMLRFC